jgi:hypothetical protein
MLWNRKKPDTYACLTGSPHDSGRPFNFEDGFFDNIRFGFAKDLTAFGQQVKERSCRPDLLNLRGACLVGPGFRQPQKIPQYGRYAGRSGLVLEKRLSSPGHGSKPGDPNYTVFSAFAFISDAHAQMIWRELRTRDWNNPSTMFVLGFPCEPFPLPEPVGATTFEGDFLMWLPGSPAIVVLGR